VRASRFQEVVGRELLEQQLAEQHLDALMDEPCADRTEH